MSKKHQDRPHQWSHFKNTGNSALPIMASAFLGTAYNITDMAWMGSWVPKL